MDLEAKNFALALQEEMKRSPYDETLIHWLLTKMSLAGDPHIVASILPLVWPKVIANESTRITINLQAAALKTISTLLAQILPEKLPTISESWASYLLRLREWTTIDIEEEAKLYFLGILSFNRNGYVRERAIADLAQFSNPAALSFILCRTIDWVPEIRAKALAVLETKLIPENANDFIKLLPLIDRLALSSRAIGLEAKICDLYRSESGMQLLLAALKTERKIVRGLICRILDKIVHDIPADVLDIITNDCDPAVRFWLTRWEERLRSINPSKASQLRKLLINDASAKIRNTMILASLAAKDEDVDVLLYNSLFDISSGIREMARYYIKKDNALDFASLYRQMLSEKGIKLQIAIAGLGETGISSDYELILPLLSGSSQQIREALKALMKLDSSRARLQLLGALADHHPTVRHLALKALPDWLSAEYQETLLNVWHQAASDHARSCIAKSMLRLPPWIAAHVLLRAVILSPRSQEAAHALEQWYPSPLKDYASIPPDEKEKMAIENVLKTASPLLKQSTIDRILCYLK